MHGYLMHLKLFNKLKDKLFNANILEQKKRNIEKLVNEEMPKKVESKEVIEDDRFHVKDNPEFQVNRMSEDYIIRHPNEKKKIAKEKIEYERQL